VSEATLRCFLAVELEAPMRAEIAHIGASLGGELSGARFTPADNLHLTLKFMGELAQSAVERLAEQAAAKLAREPGFEVTLEGLGAFPNAREARVFWLGVSRGGGALARLARKLDATAARFGVPKEKRPYQAHLTLARLREPAPIPLERIAAPGPLQLAVERVTLFESRLAPSGARHIPLARLSLGRNGVDDELAPELF
jgi:RNA 2',3'-cyclic 3'-phosphodiesterase